MFCMYVCMYVCTYVYGRYERNGEKAQKRKSNFSRLQLHLEFTRIICTSFFYGLVKILWSA